MIAPQAWSGVPVALDNCTAVEVTWLADTLGMPSSGAFTVLNTFGLGCVWQHRHPHPRGDLWTNPTQLDVCSGRHEFHAADKPSHGHA